MDYKRKLFTIPADLCEKLEGSSNQSGTVAEALRLYFKSKDSAKRVVALAERLEEYIIKPTQVDIPKAYRYAYACCVDHRPNIETQVVPCKHWFRDGDGYTNVLSGEVVVI